MTYQITERQLDAGDTVELGEVEDSHTEVSSGGLHLIAAWEGEPTEYVVLRFHASDGEKIESDGQILAVGQGSGIANPSVWMLIPTTEYET